MAGRPRTPTKVLDARGAFKNHPGRAKERENEPVDLPPLGVCPASFNDSEKIAWADIVKSDVAGVLTAQDYLSVEIAAQLLAQTRETQIVKNDVTGERYALPGLSDARHSQLIGLLGKFGMTPAERSKVSAPKKKQKTNPFSRTA